MGLVWYQFSKPNIRDARKVSRLSFRLEIYRQRPNIAKPMGKSTRGFLGSPHLPDLKIREMRGGISDGNSFTRVRIRASPPVSGVSFYTRS